MDQEAKAQQDRARARAPLPLAPARTGRLFEGRVARVHAPGDPLRYLEHETKGPLQQHRDAAELARIVAQLPGTKVVAPPEKPVHHPRGMLRDPRGAQLDTAYREVGKVISARVDGEWAVAEIFIDDPETLAAIDAGINELSLGYWSKPDAKGFQRDTLVDHLSVVPFARCGEDCQIGVDAAAPQADEAEMEAHADPSGSAVTVGVQAANLDHGGKACQCNSRAVVSLENVTAQPEDMKMDELQKQLDAAQAEKQAIQAKLEAAEAAKTQAEKDRDEHRVAAHDAKKELEVAVAARDAALQAAEAAKTQAQQDAAGAMQALVDARVELLTEVQPLGLKDGEDKPLDFKKLDERAIKVAAIKHIDGDDADIKDDDSLELVRGMYRSAMKRKAAAGESRKQVRQSIQQARQDGAPVTAKSKSAADEKAALAQMHKSLTTAWAQAR